MKVLVTGADGMLGSHICRALISREYQVRAMIQPGRTTDTLDELDVERVECDLLKYEDMERALSAADAVIHTAASTQIWPGRSPTIWKINFEGTKLLAKAVLESDTKKFIHIGTANSFGPGSKEHPGTEQHSYRGAKYKLDYQDSKKAAQEYLLGLAASHKLPVTIINPSFMFGAYDSKPGTGAMVIAIYRGNLLGYPSGGRSYVAAKDVADCAVNALARGRNGECYLASGTNLNYKEIFQLIADTLEVDAPRVPIPDLMIEMVGLIGSMWGTLRKQPPMLSYPMARLAHTDCYYSNAKAVNELGMSLSPLENAISECFAWLKEHRYM